MNRNREETAESDVSEGASRAATAEAEPREIEPTSPGTGQRPHVPVLDGVRGIAILLVLSDHFLTTVPTKEPSWLNHLAFGWLGVDLFFVLSGFLITGILLQTKGKPRYFRNFYGRRTVRIFPLYYGILFAVLVALPALLTLSGRWTAFPSVYVNEVNEIRSHQVWLWLYLSHVGTALFGYNWYFFHHFWSLSIEEHFYLIWPAVVRFLNGPALVIGCLATVALALATRLLFLAFKLPIYFCYMLTPCRMDGLAIGGLVAILLAGRPPGPRAARAARWVFALLLALTAANFAVVGPEHESIAINSVGYTLFACMFAALLVVALASAPGGLLHGTLNSRPLRLLGKYSYGLYVYHRLLMLPMKKLVPVDDLAARLGSLTGALAIHAAIGTALSLAVAMLSFHLYEAPFLRLKRYFA